MWTKRRSTSGRIDTELAGDVTIFPEPQIREKSHEGCLIEGPPSFRVTPPSLQVNVRMIHSPWSLRGYDSDNLLLMDHPLFIF